MQEIKNITLFIFKIIIALFLIILNVNKVMFLIACIFYTCDLDNKYVFGTKLQVVIIECFIHSTHHIMCIFRKIKLKICHINIDTISEIINLFFLVLSINNILTINKKKMTKTKILFY